MLSSFEMQRQKMIWTAGGAKTWDWLLGLFGWGPYAKAEEKVKKNKKKWCEGIAEVLVLNSLPAGNDLCMEEFLKIKFATNS